MVKVDNCEVPCDLCGKVYICEKVNEGKKAGGKGCFHAKPHNEQDSLYVQPRRPRYCKVLNRIVNCRELTTEEKICKALDGETCGVFDSNAKSIYLSGPTNNLCKAIKTSNRANFICAAAHQLAFKAANESGSAITECDAGFTKVSVALTDPETGEFAGMVSCCGIINKTGELEIENLEFLLDKTEKEIGELSAPAPVLSEDALEKLKVRLKTKAEIVSKIVKEDK